LGEVKVPLILSNKGNKMNLLQKRQEQAAREDLALIPGEDFRKIISHLEAANEYTNGLSNTKIRLWIENLKGYEPQAICGAIEQYAETEELIGVS
jgi:hypothetical protein